MASRIWYRKGLRWASRKDHPLVLGRTAARHRPMAGRSGPTVSSTQRGMRKAGVDRSPSRAKGVKRCRVRQGAARSELTPQQTSHSSGDTGKDTKLKQARANP